MALLFTACSKDDDTNAGDFRLARIISNSDTTQFSYNADGTIKQFNEFGIDGIAYHDSTQVLWENGKLVKISEYEQGTLSPQVLLTYSGDKVVKAQYYTNYPAPGTPAGYDSIRYENDKVSEIHRIDEAGDRPYYTKVTWTGNNVTKTEVFASNFDGTGNYFPGTVRTYEYSSKANIGSLTKGNLLAWMYDDFTVTFLSANAMTKEVAKQGEQELFHSTYEYVADGNGLISSLKETYVEGADSQIYETKLEYVRK